MAENIICRNAIHVVLSFALYLHLMTKIMVENVDRVPVFDCTIKIHSSATISWSIFQQLAYYIQLAQNVTLGLVTPRSLAS